jgi:hypothetical protein
MKPKYGPPEALADDDVGALARTRGAPLSRRLEQRERGRVHHGDDQRAVRVRPVGEGIHVLEHAEEIGLLHHDRAQVLTLEAL